MQSKSIALAFMPRECTSTEADPGFVGAFSNKQTYAKYEYKIRYANVFI